MEQPPPIIRIEEPSGVENTSVASPVLLVGFFTNANTSKHVATTRNETFGERKNSSRHDYSANSVSECRPCWYSMHSERYDSLTRWI